LTTLRNFPVEEFLWGLGAAVLALLAAAVESRRHPDHALVMGLVTTPAAVGAISRTWSVVPAALLGLGGVVTALAWLERRRLPTGPSLTMAAVLTTPFAAILAVDASSTGWVRVLVGTSVVLGALAASRTDAAWGETGVPPALYAITAAGVFAAVPDTEQAATLLGASLPMALCGWPLGHAHLGPTGAGAAAALLVWVAAVGGRGREPSIVGAIACLGLLVTLPAGRWLGGRAGHYDAVGRCRHAAALVVCVHLAVVAVASRVAGVTTDLHVAVPVATVTMLAALATGAWLSATRP
jgi:hypothetical protein